jgi:hypothetical protein
MVDQKTIAVMGDVTLDWLEEVVPRSHNEALRNYELHSGFRWTPVWGGAALLERLLKSAIEKKLKLGAASRFIFEDGRGLLPDETSGDARAYLQSLAVVRQMINDQGKPIRVDSFRGFMAEQKDKIKIAPYSTNVSSLACLVVDDAANGCRDDDDFVKHLTSLFTDAPLIVLKLSRPLNRSRLMGSLVRRGPNSGQRVVIIVNADDLRAQGVDISRRLSWERSAADLVTVANDSPILSDLSRIGDVLVRFGNDGCVVLEHDTNNRFLVFDPRRAEDGYDQQLSGTMPGATSAFTAEIAAALLLSDEPLHCEARQALCASRRLLRSGFVRDETTKKLDYPLDVFPAADAPEVENDFKIIKLPAGIKNMKDWSILSATLSTPSLQDIGEKIVREGHEEHLKEIPVATFGKLLLVDKNEIEGYRSIDNLLREYIRSRHGGMKPRPISIAVFGPPGSGKSFGINEIAKGLTDAKITSWPFNLTQFKGPDDLIGAFHIARDEALKGNLPLLIFDEFDTSFDNEPWGWLKFFLAPMQDGEFNDNGHVHPVGHAIFVFAGGIAERFDEFGKLRATSNSEVTPESNSSPAAPEVDPEFRQAKGPDFASRLKGYVDVGGINPAATNNVEDSALDSLKVNPVCVVRRAILLRAKLLEQEYRTHNMNPIKDGKSYFDIDKAVLKALLEVKKYRHGARSLESILAMSSLAGRDHFNVASLPSEAQLKIHVDDSFIKILKEHASGR